MQNSQDPPFSLQPTITGELVDLRPLAASDLDDLFTVASDPLIWEQHPAKNRCKRDVFKIFFKESLASGGALVIIDRQNGKIIGSSRYHDYIPAESVVEIGWSFLARSYWGGVYNREVKHLMLNHAFKHLMSVIFLVNPANIRSCKAVEKIGGHHTGYRNKAGNRLLVYRIDKDNFMSQEN